jgi:hypothetical protein
MDITKERFEHEMNRGKTFQELEPDRADYWIGYQRGLILINTWIHYTPNQQGRLKFSFL